VYGEKEEKGEECEANLVLHYIFAVVNDSKKSGSKKTVRKRKNLAEKNENGAKSSKTKVRHCTMCIVRTILFPQQANSKGKENDLVVKKPRKKREEKDKKVCDTIFSNHVRLNVNRLLNYGWEKLHLDYQRLIKLDAR